MDAKIISIMESALRGFIEDLIQSAADSANREDDLVSVNGEGWTCEIEKMGDGSFKVLMSWAVSEPVTKKAAAKKPAAKKRGRKKKAPANQTEEVK